MIEFCVRDWFFPCYHFHSLLKSSCSCYFAGLDGSIFWFLDYDRHAQRSLPVSESEGASEGRSGGRRLSLLVLSRAGTSI